MKNTKRIVAVLLALLLLCPLWPNALAETTETIDLSTSIEKAVSFYKSQPTLTSCWDVLALASAGVAVETEGFTFPDLTAWSAYSTSEHALRTLTALALNKDPRNLALLPDGRKADYIAELEARADIKEDGSVFYGDITSLTFGILALELTDPNGYPRAYGSATLRLLQHADGGFSYAGNDSDVDITAMALLALSRFGEPYRKETQAAVNYLLSQMTNNGGYISPWSPAKAENACTVATVISGLCAAGYADNAAVAKMTANLLSFQLEDGSFCYEPGGGSDAFATRQALLALGDLKNGSLYNRLTYSGEQTTRPLLERLYADASAISEWAVEPVEFMFNKNIMTGAYEFFKPRNTLSRGDFFLMLYRLAAPESFTTPSLPSDVKRTDYYAQAALWAVGAGLAEVRDGQYRPQAAITREEAALAIAKYYELDTSIWKSVSAQITDWDSITEHMRPYVAAIFNEGIMVGHQGRFRPQSTLTREEAAKLFCNILT